MSIGALFIIAKSCTQPRGPSTEEFIQKMWYIYTMSTTQLLKQWIFEILGHMDVFGGNHP